MPSPRSLFAARQQRQNESPNDPHKSNGLFWVRRSMNDSSPDSPLFSFKSMFSSLSSPTNMQQSGEQTKEPPQPAPSIQNHLSLAPDYAEQVFRRFHHHNLSDSSATTSNDSSPTTTISLVDDSSATEPSPGSSPESPPPSTFTVGMLRPRTSDDSRPFFELQKQLPPKKGRNLKNLAVNTTRTPGRASSTTSLPLPLPTGMQENFAIVGSPTFVKPPTPPKRKPSNLGLTLLTPGGSTKAPPQEIRLAIPPTPGFGRPGTLRHFQSSPSLPLFPGLGSQPPIPSLNTRVNTTLETIFSPTENEPEVIEEKEEQNFDVPLSQEEKPEAYPDGPICVYEPNIDLFLEPTAEQCMQYDVVMNVASEVRNPFDESAEHAAEEEPEIRIDGGGGIQYAPRRDKLVVPKAEPQSELGGTQDGSPTTPKATPLTGTFSKESITSDAKKEPEYIHQKWEHNSDIVPDLLRLVKLIDEKATQGKRVLVHCQCGVSRSASLVVAYGLYKNPSLSVQEAYDAVKKRSKWIGPNMNLIMQLQEFRTSLMHGGVLAANRGFSPVTPSSAIDEWIGPFSSNASRSIPISARMAKQQTPEPASAISPGPASAPSAWSKAPGARARALSAVKPGTAYVDPSGHVVPMVPVVPTLNVVEVDAPPKLKTSTRSLQLEETKDESDSSITPTEPLQSPRSEEFAMTPLQPSPDFDPADSFGVMSPTSTEFASSPFDRAALLAQLGMGPVGHQEDLQPRRSLSLRSKTNPTPPPPPATTTTTTFTNNTVPTLSSEPKPPLLRLRGKISSPNLREQQQLQSLQAKIEASLPSRQKKAQTTEFHDRHTTNSNNDDDDALLSPRAEEFTQNPFALSISVPKSSGGLSPCSPNDGDLTVPTSPTDEVSSPNASPRSSNSDPRSPAHKGVSPITRNILDVL